MDIFDSVIDLEKTFYNEGYALGTSDGTRAGRIEGRVFGLEKGFEKFCAMGRLAGRAAVLAERMPAYSQSPGRSKRTPEIVQDGSVPDVVEARARAEAPAAYLVASGCGTESIDEETNLPALTLPLNSRLEKHIRTLYALTELDSLSTLNTEDSVSDFEDRFKRAGARLRIIEKLIGERSLAPGNEAGEGAREHGMTLIRDAGSVGEGNIEDINLLGVRQ
ncbi:MAG: hypothetical protein M1829_000877 [Trizodia sp. TS-e1964]|nr:MAG: hypothetical protein M1829_000877 [Trizodia sp. TS-e1964]